MTHSFERLHGRLAMFHAAEVDRGYWEQRWSDQKIESVLAAYRTASLGEFERVFARYLPRDRPVLEAGCGMGQLVMALHARGYQAEGIDYAADTIARVKAVAPELAVRVADITNIDRPDGFYGGYVSIGIFEHEPKGPLAGMREMRRVLAPDGYALVAVPYLNARRRALLATLAEIGDPANAAGGFYQYYFDAEEFERLLVEAGMEIVERFPYAVEAGLTRDYRLGRTLAQRGFFHWRLRRAFNRMCLAAPDVARWRYAHMLMLICRPRS